MRTDEEITKLTDEWYNLIGPDHHKDKDCHFYVSKVWSYGQPPIYRVEHFGYISEIDTQEFGTCIEAEKYLKQEIEGKIQRYKESDH